MSEHTHGDWTRKRLEQYVGTTETLVLEFKSCRSLLADQKRDRNERILEAAMDVAAMANEQGGTIIYGIEEEKSGGGVRRAKRVEEGFGPVDGVSREWFLQFIRDRVRPPLNEIDAAEVRLDGSGQRFALVVLVPQARGTARQTDDMLFWRRDAQGRRKMTVQEIEDVRSRAVRPELVLGVFVEEMLNSNDASLDIKAQFRIENVSEATASFGVVTIGVINRSSADFADHSDWRMVQYADDLKIGRCVLSSGSTRRWSPITPGFQLVTQTLRITTPFYREMDLERPRPLGVVSLDHDGGSVSYVLSLHFYAVKERKLQLTRYRGGPLPGILASIQFPPILIRPFGGEGRCASSQ